MELPEYPSNANSVKNITEKSSLNSQMAEKEKRKELKKNDISSSVSVKRNSFATRFVKTVFAEDINLIKEHIVWDVILPRIRDGIKTTLIGTVEAIIGGGKASYPTTQKSSISMVSWRDSQYRDYSKTSTKPAAVKISPAGLYEDLQFSNPDDPKDTDGRAEADAHLALSKAEEVIDMYKVLTISDYYSMNSTEANRIPLTPQMEKYGWTDLSSARVSRYTSFSGKVTYVVEMPEYKPI